MYKNITFIAVFIAVFHSGCTEYSQPKPDAKQKIEIILLKEQVKELAAKDKQLIYRSIKDDIYKYNENGNEANENGYNYDAIKAYELVNFYEGYSYIPKKKIRGIKKVAKKRSVVHYKKGVKYFNSNKKRALAEFNLVMINNPEYKDTQKKLVILSSDRSIKIFINSLESSLHTKVLNCSGNIYELKDINFKLHKLLKYDYDNKIALNSREVLKKYNTILLQKAIALYDKGDINKAKKRFTQILEIYKKDATALKYLAKVKVKKSINSNLYLAKNYLNKKEYQKSIKYAYKVLKIDFDNKQAKKTIVKAKKESRKKVTLLVNQGKIQYSDKKLDESKKSFKAALKIDPNCNEALIYSKKIQRQLETIKSLE